MIGQTLSHYKIIEKLGQGGMGEVYLAEDSRLDRKVALKILPEHLSDRAELRERFEREARAVSSLNHPHICTLHDIGEQDGIHYLVMEHLVGETLEARLAKGPLPLEQTLEYAIQIADALDKAHRQGVVHRDLKPGNIMLVKSGAKLLDFGLAKLQATETPTNLSALPTEQANLTAEGTILGTLQYMAPEQLEGKEADSRTDIFAFGAVVYEMATGKKAFEGKSQASLIGAIMQSAPKPMAELQPMTPATLDHIVRRCMSKAPEDRWQASSDVMAELRWVVEGGSQPDLSAPVHSRQRNRERLGWGFAVALAALAGVSFSSLTSPGTPLTQPPTRFAVHLPRTDQLNGRSMLSFSPDGRTLVYAARRAGVDQLFRRSLDQLDVLPIPGTEEAGSPFLSPDGRWVAFTDDDRKLKKVSIEGGSALTLCDATLGGGSWGSDGTIIFTPSYNQGLWRVSAAGGTPEALTTPDSSEGVLDHWWPQILPGGQEVLFTLMSTPIDQARIGVYSLETGEERVLIEGGIFARYVPTGHIVYVRTGILMAVPFDLARLEVTGPACASP